MPAYGGSLFDPDRYPFLEGRSMGTNWTANAGRTPGHKQPSGASSPDLPAETAYQNSRRWAVGSTARFLSGAWRRADRPRL